MKIRSVEADLFHVDRETDMNKETVSHSVVCSRSVARSLSVVRECVSMSIEIRCSVQILRVYQYVYTDQMVSTNSTPSHYHYRYAAVNQNINLTSPYHKVTTAHYNTVALFNITNPPSPRVAYVRGCAEFQMLKAVWFKVRVFWGVSPSALVISTDNFQSCNAEISSVPQCMAVCDYSQSG